MKNNPIRNDFSGDNSRIQALSIIVPFYNESENVAELHRQLLSALSRIGCPFQIIYVDDGSTDDTFTRLNAQCEMSSGECKGGGGGSPSEIVLVRLRRNFGQTAALAAGLEQATGDVIITMDGDLQNDPNDIPKLLQLIDEGYDVVSGWRKERKDPLIRRLPSKVANWLISLVTGVKLRDYGCTLKAYRSEVIRSVELHGDMHRFLPALCSWQGASIAEVVVNHRPRVAGRSKYGLGRTFRVLLDLLLVKFLLSYASRPLHIFGGIGILLGTIGFVLAAYLSYRWFFLGESLARRPSLLLAVLLLIVGVQFIAMGLLAELITRTYHQAQGKEIYVIRHIRRFTLSDTTEGNGLSS